MRVKLAREAGFCMGVRRAMIIALDVARRRPGTVYTLGPLIHNPQVVRVLEAQGIRAVASIDEIPHPEQATVIIRSHGVAPDVLARLRASGARVINATCPHVARVQGIARARARAGEQVIVVGDPDHAEVRGILGHAGDRGVAVPDAAALDRVELGAQVCVVAQTTQDEDVFRRVVDALRGRRPAVRVHETICSATRDRQREIRRLARAVDAMVVVGGRNSANTRRLVALVARFGVPTFAVETEDELDLDALRRYRTIGLTAGASTPNWMIRRVLDRLRATGERWYARALRFVISANFYVAIGAAFLSYASCRIAGVTPRLAFAFIAATYVFAVHLLNHFTDRAALAYSEPMRALFYERQKLWLVVLGVGAAAFALAVSIRLGIGPFIFLALAMLFGLSYRITYLPARFRYRRLMDIPASKDLFVALAWAAVLVILPVLAARRPFTAPVWVALAFAFVLVFVRAVLFSFRDLQGDVIAGRETVPVIIGRARARVLLAVLPGLLTALLVAAVLAHWLPAASLLLVVVAAYLYLYLYLYDRHILRAGVRFEAVVDASFMLAGLVSLAAHHLF